jgi:hypothetical protein
MKEKVVVLRELQGAIIYTRELNKQAIEGIVSTAFTVYSVIKGARLTSKNQKKYRDNSLYCCCINLIFVVVSMLFGGARARVRHKLDLHGSILRKVCFNTHCSSLSKPALV